jgi:HK97 family phage major capsid protein
LYITPDEELADKQQRLLKILAVSDSPALPVESRINALDQMAGNEIRNADMIDVAAGRMVDSKPGNAEDRAQDGTAEMRAASERAALLVAGTPEMRAAQDGPEWANLFPTHDEYRALMATGAPANGGYTVPAKVGNQWIEQLRNQSVFLAAPGINLVPFDSATFRIPQVLTSDRSVVTAEGATIPKANMTFGPLDFTPLKYGFIYQASSEVLEDSSLNIEALVAQTMIENIASDVDKDAFQGNGTTGLAGVSSTSASNTATTLAAGTTQVTWDHVLDAYIAILATGRRPSVVWCSMDQYRGLIKSRENGSTGAYLAGSVTADPTSAAWGIPILPSNNVPARTVLVADASRVYIGVRRDVTVLRSDEYGFGEDLVSWRATARWAGIRVAESTSVQKVVAAAS